MGVPFAPLSLTNLAFDYLLSRSQKVAGKMVRGFWSVLSGSMYLALHEIFGFSNFEYATCYSVIDELLAVRLSGFSSQSLIVLRQVSVCSIVDLNLFCSVHSYT